STAPANNAIGSNGGDAWVGRSSAEDWPGPDCVFPTAVGFAGARDREDGGGTVGMKVVVGVAVTGVGAVGVAGGVGAVGVAGGVGAVGVAVGVAVVPGGVGIAGGGTHNPVGLLFVQLFCT